MPFSTLNAVSIDDNQANHILIEEFCATIDLNITNFTSPLKSLIYLKKNHNNIDIIFIDYMMPELNGIELIKEFRKFNTDTPIIMITILVDNHTVKVEALKAGATDFLTKPLDLSEFQARTNNLLNLRLAQNILQDRSLQLQTEVNKATIELINREHETLNLLSRTAEYKDTDTANHVTRVSYYSKLLAQEIGLSEESQDVLFYASSFHDLGKVGIPDNILLKPSKLTPTEFEKMKEHTLIGHRLLENSSSKYLKEGGNIALHHHEKFDGTGYPQQLKAEEIPIFSRIAAIADVFDALTSNRPYKKKWSLNSSFEYLGNNKGTHFDPTLIDIFITNREKIHNIYNKYSD